jgi:plasmid stabilization system protein ParE
MQAGILLGSNDGIPAFRWYDRDRGRVMVSNNARDAGLIEQELSTGHGLLAGGGASRGNLFSGDAPDSLFTFSTLLNPTQRSTTQYFLFYTNLYNLARTIALFVADFFHEVFAASWQVLRNERPRVRRFGVYPLVRSATTSVLRELSTFTVAGDMLRGVPAIYTTYVAYDEVAHHSGTERGDALRVLRLLDRDIARLARVAGEAPRPYHLVVLSDHGQTQGATFRQRYGETLAEVVERAIDHPGNGHDRHVVAPREESDEGWAMVSVLLTDFLNQDRSDHPVMEAALRRRRGRGQIDLGPDDSAPTGERVDHDGEVVVVASGNLGLISFTSAPARLTMEEIGRAYPRLIQELVEHPGVAFAVMETDELGPIAIGHSGFYALAHDEVHGDNPLAGYEAYVPAMLRRSSGFRNAPDIYVAGTWWQASNEVAAFEELVSSHGGLGGGQSTPFLLSPAGLPLCDEPIVGAEALHRVLKGWVKPGQAPGARQ